MASERFHDRWGNYSLNSRLTCVDDSGKEGLRQVELDYVQMNATENKQFGAMMAATAARAWRTSLPGSIIIIIGGQLKLP
jgi:hypothetical protein